MRLFLAASVLCASFSALVVAACSSSDTSAGSGSDDAGGDAARESGSPPDPGEDAGPSTCALTRAYDVACAQDLNCGPDKFDAWCAQNDLTNSAAFRRAEAKCLTPTLCDGTQRRDCEYRSYGTATPTSSQVALVAAYCQTCEPSDVGGCETRATTYDPDAGPASATDLFVAAWELADPITDEIRTKCTGAALDAGADAAGCAKAFGSCSGDVYIDHLPDCPP